MPSISVPGVTYTGPMFDGTSLRVAALMMREIDQAVGKAGVQLVQRELDQNLQNPTGYYRSQIHYTTNTRETVITDGGVIYGPWLEGTGSRNRTTKFKGYADFRKATQQLSQAAQLIGQTVVDRMIGQLQ